MCKTFFLRVSYECPSFQIALQNYIKKGCPPPFSQFPNYFPIKQTQKNFIIGKRIGNYLLSLCKRQ